MSSSSYKVGAGWTSQREKLGRGEVYQLRQDNAGVQTAPRIQKPMAFSPPELACCHRLGPLSPLVICTSSILIQGTCVPYLSQCCNRMPHKSDLKQGRLILLSFYSLSWQGSYGSRSLKQPVALGPQWRSIGGWVWGCFCSAYFLLYSQSGTQAMACQCPRLEWVFPPQLPNLGNLSWIYLEICFHGDPRAHKWQWGLIMTVPILNSQISCGIDYMVLEVGTLGLLCLGQIAAIFCSSFIL